MKRFVGIASALAVTAVLVCGISGCGEKKPATPPPAPAPATK